MSEKATMVKSMARFVGPVEIHGFCDPRFARVKDAFHQNFLQRGEVGASVAVTIGGEPVVDLWGGEVDAWRTMPWREDTIACVQSVSKEILALAIHILIDRGLLDVDAPVTRYWPEYGQFGKETTTVRFLLDHRAGVPVAEGAYPGMAYDWNEMTEALAATRPLWEPGTTPCYHSANYGYLVGEVLRRITGQSPAEFVRSEIAAPLGIACYSAMSPAEEANVATFLDKEAHISQRWIDQDDSIFARSWKIFWQNEDFNSPEWRRSEVPSVNFHSNARSLARLGGLMACGGTIDGISLIGEDALDRAGERQWTDTDAQGRPLSLSLGFLLPHADNIATADDALMFVGAGGATAFADRHNRVGFGYVMNSMEPEGRTRSNALIRALQDTL